MQKWNLGRGDPLCLTLVCDARLGVEPSFTNDQIWELSLGSGEPPALALQTSYGLRARSMRIFPRFSEHKTSLSDPQAFHQPPHIHKFYPNLISLSYSPFLGIDVSSDYWVPTSQSLAGRVSIANHSIVPRQFDFELVALLTPLEEGECMATRLMGVTPVLSGKTANLEPVLFITGGPEAGSGSFPALRLPLDLLPGNQRTFTWCLASLETAEESFHLARQTTARHWEAEAARIQQIQAAQLPEIYTGDADWDAALAFSQKTALSLFTVPVAGLPNRSIVQSRRPDQGYSRRADGSDAPPQWEGPSTFDLYTLLDFLLPGAVDLAEGVFCNFLATQQENGWIDWKPGAGGARSRLHAQPLLASLAWRIHRCLPDDTFLRKVYPGLRKYLSVWFDGQHDRDRDGIPEWEHPYQTGLDDHPLFDRWRAAGKGIDASTVEDPALAALLFQECRLLQRMAHILGDEAAGNEAQARLDSLAEYIASAWEPRRSTFRVRDRDSHTHPRPLSLGRRNGPGVIPVHQSYDPPVRLTIRVQSGGETTRLPIVRVIGQRAGTPVEETISNLGLIWIHQQVTLTTQEVFSQVDRVEVEGISPRDRTSVHTTDLNTEAISALLPLWAHAVDDERARRIVEKNLLDPHRYGLQYGFPTCPQTDQKSDPEVRLSVHPLWNHLIGEGLNRYGYTRESADLVTRLMAGVIQSLKREAAFHQVYRADNGEGMGEANSLSGLVPLGLFLQTLGVELISPTQVILRGNNPFPWPITVKYRGLTLVRREQDTWITFPDGQTTRAPGPGTHLVSLS